MPDFYTGAVILAAGTSTRMGRDKIMLRIGGRPVIEYSVRAFEAAQTVGEIVVVASEFLAAEIKELLNGIGASKVKKVVCGGDTRMQSAICGMNALSHSCRYISIHDAARPLITPDDIDAVHREAYIHGAVCCGMPVADTIKSVDSSGFVVSTLNRGGLRAIATPQAFDIDLYRRAAAEAEGSFTDDAGMVEACGIPVKFVECRSDNFKITVPSDIDRFERSFL